MSEENPRHARHVAVRTGRFAGPGNGAGGTATGAGQRRPARVTGEEPARVVAGPVPRPATGGLSVVVTSVASDAHTWNLVFLQLAFEELGHRVHNLGACVPDELLVSECLRVRPDLVVVSSVNGHGFRDGMRLIGHIRSRPELATLPVVIGGKLDTVGAVGPEHHDLLRAAGYDAVFDENSGLVALRSFTRQLTMSVGT